MGGGRTAVTPHGYARLGLRRGHAVVQHQHADALRQALADDATLHAWAGRVPGARAMQGRGVAWAVSLPDGTPVVVRHNRHGGLLARLTGDRFLAPTHAQRELDLALRLAAAGVPTPEVVAYVVYPAGPVLARSDVATREVPDAEDLGVLLARTAPGDVARLRAYDATAALVAALARAGARHADLNAKNVLLADGGARALVLDVDRVSFGDDRAAALEANLARLARSLRKHEAKWGARFAPGEVDALADLARRALGR